MLDTGLKRAIHGGPRVRRGGRGRRARADRRRRWRKEILAEPRAYAKIVEGEIALRAGEPRQAIELLTQANTLLDTWLGHFDLGRAYLAAGPFPQADSEFERCVKRGGEALQLILGEEPTYAYLPPVYYYQGQVREGMKVEGAADSYRGYLDFRGNIHRGPVLAGDPEARPVLDRAPVAPQLTHADRPIRAR